MKEKIETKLEFLKKKKEEYLAQIMALNGAIQVLEEILNDSKETSNGNSENIER